MEKNSLGLNKKEMENLYGNEPSKAAKAFMNAHTHWLDSKGFCKICKKAKDLEAELNSKKGVSSG